MLGWSGCSLRNSSTVSVCCLCCSPVRLLPRTTQILLFSATFDNNIRNFARAVAPNAVEIAVKTEELSLDSIKQFFINCRSDQEKYSTLTAMYGLLEIGQSIIFVHTVATAKMLANRMRSDGYTVSLLHGKDMQPAERDRVMEDFRAQKTTVLITTNVLARGIDVLSITLVVNFDIPLNKYNKPRPGDVHTPHRTQRPVWTEGSGHQLRAGRQEQKRPGIHRQPLPTRHSRAAKQRYG